MCEKEAFGAEISIVPQTCNQDFATTKVIGEPSMPRPDTGSRMKERSDSRRALADCRLLLLNQAILECPNNWDLIRDTDTNIID